MKTPRRIGDAGDDGQPHGESSVSHHLFSLFLRAFLLNPCSLRCRDTSVPLLRRGNLDDLAGVNL